MVEQVVNELVPRVEDASGFASTRFGLVVELGFGHSPAARQPEGAGICLV